MKDCSLDKYCILFLLSPLWICEQCFSQQLGDLRLSGFESGKFSGRVEVYYYPPEGYDSQDLDWFNLCDDHIDNKTGNVICRQLGLGYLAHLYKTDQSIIRGYKVKPDPHISKISRFGMNSGIVGPAFECYHGNESHILDCRLVNYTCAPHETVEVQCSDYRPQPYSGQVRLVGGEYPSEGALQIFYNGKWGGVYLGDHIEAKPDDFYAVACRQLGYTDMLSLDTINRTSSPMWRLNNTECNVLDVCIIDCLSTLEDLMEVKDCTNSIFLTCNKIDMDYMLNREPSSELCKLENTPSLGDIRIIDDDIVQIYLNETWGNICVPDNDASSVANVVCRQLGWRTLNLVHRGTHDGLRHVTEAICKGGENSILECDLKNDTFTSCTKHHNLIVECSESTTVPARGSVALFEGSGASGQLVITIEKGKFIPLCDGGFEKKEADVACRQLGYTHAIGFKKNSYYGSILNTASITNIKCLGNESHLFQCKHSIMDDSCVFNQIGVQCGTDGIERNGNLRLNNGNTTNTSMGRLEIFVDGEWRGICSNNFKASSGADVACRQIGYVGAEEVYEDGRFGDFQNGVFRVLNCHGSEEKLLDCHYKPVLEDVCYKDVAIKCSDAPPLEEGTVRLTGGPSDSSGRLEIYLYNRWGTVCSTNFHLTEAKVICRQLKFPEAGLRANIITNSNYNISNLDLPINIHSTKCHGNEKRLVDCPFEVYPGSCNHSQDVGIICYNIEISSPSTPPLPVVVGITVGIICLLLLVVMTCLILCVLIRRKQKTLSEPDWFPRSHIDQDMSYENPKFDPSLGNDYI